MIKTEDYLVDDLNMEPESPTAAEGKEVKRRNRLNPRQVNRLMQVFEQTAKPKADIRHKLAEELGMHPRAVQIWFQNRRQKLKKESLEATSAESKFPIDQAKLTLCDAKQVYSHPQDAYFGLPFSNFPQLVKPGIANGPSSGFQTPPTNVALLSGLGLVSNQGSIHSSATPLSLSHTDYQDTVQPLDSGVHNSLTLLQGCDSLPVQQDVSFSNLFNSNELELMLDGSPPSGTSISATSSEANCPDQLVDMGSTINNGSPFMYAVLDSFGLDLSTQIGMLQRQQSFPQNYPAKRKAYSWQDLCQMVPPSQELDPVSSTLSINRTKLPNIKRNASDAGYSLSQYPVIMPNGLDQGQSRAMNARSHSDPFAVESYREAKRLKLFNENRGNGNPLSSVLTMDQESSSTAGGLSNMLAYL